MKKSSKQKQRLEPLERRRLIVKAAIECIFKKGIHATSYADIAEMARVQQPLIHYYYPTFESLLVECMQMTLESIRMHQISAIEISISSPRKALRAYMLSPLDWATENPKLQPLWLYGYHLSTTNRRFRELNNEIRRTGRERIKLLILQIIEKTRRSLPASCTSEDLSWSMQSAISGYLLVAVTEDTPIGFVRQRFENEIDLAFNALFGNEGAVIKI